MLRYQRQSSSPKIINAHTKFYNSFTDDNQMNYTSNTILKNVTFGKKYKIRYRKYISLLLSRITQ